METPTVEDALGLEVHRLFRTMEDVERMSAQQAFDLLELVRGARFDAKRKRALMNKISKRRREILMKNRLSDIERNNGGGGAASSDSHSSSDDDGNEDDSDSDAKSGAKEGGPVSTISSSSNKQVGGDGEVELAEREILARRKLMIMRETAAQRKFSPYSLPFREKVPPVMGAMGMLLDPTRCPAFENFIVPEDKINFRGSVALYAEVNRVVAVPVARGRARFLSNSYLSSGKLPGAIFQVAQLHHPSGAWFATRHERTMTLVGMNPEERTWELRDTSEQWKPEGDLLLHLAPSPFEPGRIAVLKRTSLHLWDVHECLQSQRLSKAPETSQFRKCAFGPHPNQIYVCTKKQLFLNDSRKSRSKLVDVFEPYQKTTGDLMESDILTFARVPSRRDEILIVTRTDMFLMDVRSPGRFIARETHSFDFDPSESCSTEMVFSSHHVNPFAFIWSTSNDPRYALLGPMPALPSLDPELHRKRVRTGLPFDLLTEDPIGLGVGTPLAPYDDVRSLVDPLTFRVKVPRVMAANWERVRRLPETKTAHIPQSKAYWRWPGGEPEMQSILAAGFFPHNTYETVMVIGSTFSHLERHHYLAEPILISKEMDF